MQRRHLGLLSFAFFSGVMLSGSGVGCVEPNPDHCVNNGGDSFCGEQHPDWGTAYCTDSSCGGAEADGCVEALPSAECWYCGGAEEQDCEDVADTADEISGDTTDETAEDTSSETATETDTSETTTGPECTTSDECDPETPLCDGGECVACGDASETTCAADYPDTPACGSGGGCVVCTLEDASACSGTAPTCGYEEACVGCWEHSQCSDSACNMSTGACMDVERVWWVDKSAADGGDGSEGAPFDAIADALVLVGEGEEGTIYLVEGDVYSTSFTIDPLKTVAVIGQGLPVLDVAGTAITIEGGGVGMIESVLLKDSQTGIGNSGEAWLNNLHILNNAAEGIRANNGEVHVTNSFLGGSAAAGPAIHVIQGTVHVSHTTVLTGSFAAAIVCLVGNGVGSSIGNSIVGSLAGTPEIEGCDQLSVEGSALEMSVGDNLALGDFDPSWVSAFPGGDFHLSPSAPAELATAAVWQPYDPTTDIDGDPRPTTPGAEDYAGADLIP